VLIRRLVDAVALVALVAIWIVVLAAFPSLPATIPTHFQLDGTATGYGPKGTIFLLPIIATVVCASLLASGRLGARYLNLPFTIPPAAMPRALAITHLFVALINAMTMLLMWTIVALIVYVAALYRLRA
jgi:uncharacterized membrane protein